MNFTASLSITVYFDKWVIELNDKTFAKSIYIFVIVIKILEDIKAFIWIYEKR